MSQSAYSTPAGNVALVHTLVTASHLAILVLLYGQTYSFDFVYFDDYEYVPGNSIVVSGLTLEGLKWAFTTFYMSNWHPLTWLSHMLDVSLFGVDPGWAHLHNAALHGVNSLLVYAILLKLSGSWWKACILSLVFLVHPLHVESVAWIAERKDLLCALFFLAGLLFYDSYRARPGKLLYFAVLISYILALLSKPMAVTFPIVLLILDFFVYRNCFEIDTEASKSVKIDYAKAVIEKLPLLTLSVAISALTIVAQDAGNAVAYLEIHSISARLSIAASAYVIYLKQFLLPVDLVAFYPISRSASSFEFLLPTLTLLLMFVFAMIYARAFPLIAAGLFWFFIMLLPVIGLIQVGSQAHADRYMYLPSIGVLISCIYLLPSTDKKYFRFGVAFSVLFTTYLTLICFWQIGYWRNQNVLFHRVLAEIGPNYRAHIHLAVDYTKRGMLQEARQHGQAALNIKPASSDAYQAMGGIALAENKFQEAEKFYRLAIYSGPQSLDPGRYYATLVNNLGITLAKQDRITEAKQTFERALQLEPTLLEARRNLELYGAGQEARR